MGFRISSRSIPDSAAATILWSLFSRHQRGLRVLLDVIFNHFGANWLYPPGTPGGEIKAAYTAGQYPFGAWHGEQGQAIVTIAGGEDGVWPSEFQDPDSYT